MGKIKNLKEVRQRNQSMRKAKNLLNILKKEGININIIKYEQSS